MSTLYNPLVIGKHLLPAMLFAAGAGCAMVAPAPDLPRYELLFARHADPGRSNYDLWRMCGDGTQLASLVTGADNQFQPGVSPDGDHFAYAAQHDGQWDIHLQGFRNGAARNLTEHPADDNQPAFSPDGKNLVFSSKRDSAYMQLYLLEIETGQVRRLTSNPHWDSGAAFFPDNERVVFTRYIQTDEQHDREGGGELMVLNLVTGEEAELTALGGFNGDADVSPDGTTVGFHRVANGRAELWLIDSNGQNPRQLTDTLVDEYTPRWSPDCEWLAFTAGTGNDSLGTFDLWLMRPDGGARFLLNGAANTEAWHRWRPVYRCR